MKASQLEALAIDTIDRVSKRLAIEPTRFELKAVWPQDPVRVARRLAAHCNEVADESAVWLIGLDEKRGVVGCQPQDLAEWWPRVQSRFHQTAPTMIASALVGGIDRPVVAMEFSTEHAPFVVPNPSFGGSDGSGGPVELEVPWREGARTRSATRMDLLRLLGRRAKSPTVAVLKMGLYPSEKRGFIPRSPEAIDRANWHCWIQVAIAPKSSETLCYLVERTQGSVWMPPEYGLRKTSGLSVKLEGGVPDETRDITESPGAKLQHEVLQICGFTIIKIEIQLHFDEPKEWLPTCTGTLVLAPLSDEPPLSISFDASQHRPY